MIEMLFLWVKRCHFKNLKKTIHLGNVLSCLTTKNLQKIFNMNFAYPFASQNNFSFPRA